MLIKRLFLATLILITACSIQDKIPLAEKRVVPVTKEDCIKENGQWGQFGIPGGSFSCLLQANDYGKKCSDSSNCEGICLADYAPRLSNQFGTCSMNLRKFGCFEMINNGKITSMCVD